jgi:hypothetical protein
MVGALIGYAEQEKLREGILDSPLTKPFRFLKQQGRRLLWHATFHSSPPRSSVHGQMSEYTDDVETRSRPIKR